MKSFQESLYDLPVFPTFLHIPNPRQIMIDVCYKVCQDDGLAFSEVTQTEKYHPSILTVPSYLMFYPAWYVARQIIQIILQQFSPFQTNAYCIQDHFRSECSWRIAFLLWHSPLRENAHCNFYVHNQI
jgi:hypothetical protein